MRTVKSKELVYFRYIGKAKRCERLARGGFSPPHDTRHCPFISIATAPGAEPHIAKGSK